MKKIFTLLLVGLFCITLVSATWYLPWTWWDDPDNNIAQEGKLFIINQGQQWICQTQMSDNYTCEIEDKNTQKTKISFCHKTITDKKLLPNHKDIFLDKEETNVLSLNQKQRDGKVCYERLIDTETYLSFNPVVEYQDMNMLNYNLDFAEVNLSLTCENVPMNDLWIKYNNDSYKFGANGTFEGLRNCTYKVNSNSPLYKDGNIVYVKNPDKIHDERGSYSETHEFNFDDICTRGFHSWNTTEDIDGENYTITHYNETAQCEFNSYEVWNRNETVEILDEEGTVTGNYTIVIDDYYYEVTFISDKDIDPTISIGSSDWITTSLLTNVTAESGDANFTHLNVSDTAPYDSLVGYWSFDGDNVNSKLSTSYDWSGEGNDGTMFGDAVVNSSGGKYGDGLVLDGVGDWIDINTEVSTVPFTVVLWFNSNKLAYNGLFGAASTSQLIQYSSTRFRLRPPSSKYFDVSTMSLDTWYSLVLTKNETNYTRLYLNGDESSTGALQINETFILDGIGRATTNYYFNGSIDDVMIFNTSLTSAQITEIYNNQSARYKSAGTQKVRAVNIEQDGTLDRVNLSTTVEENLDSSIEARIGQINLSVNSSGLVAYYPFEWGSAVDISGEGNDGSIVDAVFNESGGVNETGGFEFDGSNQIDVPSSSSMIFGTGDFTVAVMCRLNETQPDAFPYIVGIGDTGANEWMFRFLSSGTTINFYGGGGTINPSFNGEYNDGINHFYVASRTSGVMRIFVDGELVVTDSSATSNLTSTKPLNIGHSEATRFITGDISHIGLFDRALTTTEIQTLYNETVAEHNQIYYTDYQNITSDTNETFTISTEADFVLPDYKFLAGNSTSSFYSPLISGDSGLEVYTSDGADTTPPTYSNIAVNTTTAGTSANFSIDWNDNVALHPNGQYIFSTNNTGTWVNESAVNFTSTPESISVVKTLNSTVGLVIGYRWFASDNVGNLNDTGIQILTTGGADTCSYTSGDWNVDCADNCVISSPINLGGNNIFITGTGTFKTSANIFNFNKLHIEGTDSNNICKATCYGGGCFIN
jgi:hypothetical protein